MVRKERQSVLLLGAFTSLFYGVQVVCTFRWLGNLLHRKFFFSINESFVTYWSDVCWLCGLVRLAVWKLRIYIGERSKTQLFMSLFGCCIGLVLLWQFNLEYHVVQHATEFSRFAANDIIETYHRNITADVRRALRNE